MEQIANLTILLLGFATFIYAVTRTEYEKCEKCDPEDCQYCPFPRCENATATPLYNFFLLISFPSCYLVFNVFFILQFP